MGMLSFFSRKPVKNQLASAKPSPYRPPQQRPAEARC